MHSASSLFGVDCAIPVAGDYAPNPRL